MIPFQTIIKTKKTFIQNIAIFCIIYSVFLFNDHYANDTFSVLEHGQIGISLINARYFTYILALIIEHLPFAIYKNLQLIQNISLVLTAYISYKIYNLFASTHSFSKTDLYIIRIASIFMFANISYYEGWYYFPEIGIYQSMGMLLCCYAIISYCKNYSCNTIDTILKSFIFLFMAINMYQVYIEAFVIICTLFAIIQNKGNFKLKDIIYEIKMLVIGATTSLANIFISSILSNMGSRHATLNFDVIVNNIYSLISLQKNIWTNFYEFVPNYVMPVTGIVLFVIFYITLKNINWKNSIWLLLLLLGMYTISFMPLLISTDYWAPPRVIPGFFIFIATAFILTVITDNIALKNFVLVFSIALTIIMAIQINRISVNNIASNKIDHEIALWIQNSIEQYEEDTNNKITTIVIGCDNAVSSSYNSIEYVACDTNLRGYAVSWNDIQLINYYTGKEYIKENMTPEQYDRFFSNKNYDNLCLEEQLKFEDNCAYLLIY